MTYDFDIKYSSVFPCRSKIDTGQKQKKIELRCRESNPGRLGENQKS